jgi:hypothetical protein
VVGSSKTIGAFYHPQPPPETGQQHTWLTTALQRENFEIGRLLHLKSEIPKSQIALAEQALVATSNLRFRDFGI